MKAGHLLHEMRGHIPSYFRVSGLFKIDLKRYLLAAVLALPVAPVAAEASGYPQR